MPVWPDFVAPAGQRRWRQILNHLSGDIHAAHRHGLAANDGPTRARLSLQLDPALEAAGCGRMFLANAGRQRQRQVPNVLAAAFMPPVDMSRPQNPATPRLPAPADHGASTVLSGTLRPRRARATARL